MSAIVLSGVTRIYPRPDGSRRAVLSGIDLAIGEGEFLCLLGPSGCGKSTLLHLLAGFDRPDAGSITIDALEVSRPDPRRQVIPQDYGLFPWRSALGNVLFALEARGVRGALAAERAHAALALVGLSASAQQHPHQLSGGQRQRVALARALVVEPEVLLMDEPFGALDAFTRYRLQDEVRRIAEDRRMTVVFVTHDIDEAVYLGDRVVMMSADSGRIIRDLAIRLPRPCDRTCSAYLAIRREVFAAFALVHDGQDSPRAGGRADQVRRAGEP